MNVELLIVSIVNIVLFVVMGASIAFNNIVITGIIVAVLLLIMTIFNIIMFKKMHLTKQDIKKVIILALSMVFGVLLGVILIIKYVL